jgi:hypothetical protein
MAGRKDRKGNGRVANKQVSKEFVGALKLSKTPAYALAVEVGLSPSQLSRVIRGRVPADRCEKELVKIGHRLGLKPGEVFQ